MKHTEDKPVLYKLEYTNGTHKYFLFKDRSLAYWFIHNEGDHVLEAIKIPYTPINVD